MKANELRSGKNPKGMFLSVSVFVQMRRAMKMPGMRANGWSTGEILLYRIVGKRAVTISMVRPVIYEPDQVEAD